MHLVSTVRSGRALEAVPFHHPGETLAPRNCGHIHALALYEQVGSDLLTDGIFRDIIEPQLDEFFARFNACSGEMACLGHGELSGILYAERYLDRRVTIIFGCLDLYDAARRDAQNSDWNDTVLFVPNLRHADFFADDRLAGHSCFLWSLV